MKKKIFITIILLLFISMITCACTTGNSQTNTPDKKEENPTENVYELTKDFKQSFTPQNATLKNCAFVSAGNASGSQVIGQMDNVNSSATWTVDVPATAYYSVAIKHLADKFVKFYLYVNETEEYDANLVGDNTTYHISVICVKLQKGKNTIKLRNAKGQGYAANLDTLTVKGFKTASNVTDVLTDQIVNEGTQIIQLPEIDGFTYKATSSDINVVGNDFKVKTPNSSKNVKLTITVTHGQDKSEKTITAKVKGKTPDVNTVAEQIFESENGKVIPKGQTNLEYPEVYEGHTVNIINSTNKHVISCNGTVNAQEQDETVGITYLIEKVDGTSCQTQCINYTVTGLGYSVGNTFINPLGVGQDPFVTFIDGWYYHIRSVHSGNQAHLEIIRSKSFIDYRNEGFKTIYTFPSYNTNAWNSHEVWGPFPLMKWTDGHYYIYYAADNGNNYNHRQGVLKSKTDDPMGEYEDLGIVNTSDNNNNTSPTVSNTRWAIGATTFTDGNKYYLVWSGWRGPTDAFPQRTYIAEIRTPTNIGARVEISSPDKSWEGINENTPIMEGQAVFYVNGKYILLYSANSSWAGRYRVGMLVYNDSSEGGFLNPSNWTKLNDPLFETTDCIESPGGPCLIPTADGKEWWFIYHSSQYVGSGWSRLVSCKPVRFGENGYPILDDPLPFYSEMRSPSGDDYIQNKIYIYEAEDAELSNSLTTKYIRSASNGAYVYGFSESGDKLTFNMNLAKAGLYKITIRYASQSDEVRHVLSVNGKKSSILYTHYGFESFYTINTTGVFIEGNNTVTLEYVQGYDCKIDFIGVEYIGE